MKKSILIIEDNPDIQEIYKICFEDAGFIVHASLDGLKGIINLLEIKPDVILLDIMMPDMNGFDVLDTIKNQSSISIPTIICSNLSQQSDIDKALSLGANKFLVKSDFTGPKIVEEVIKLLDEVETT